MESSARFISRRIAAPGRKAHACAHRVRLQQNTGGVRGTGVSVATPSSVPVRQDFLGFRNLIGGTGEVELQFSGAANHLDFDGIQAAVLHSQAELFVGFVEAVSLEAVAHG
jgi:hypothetical protein